MLTQKQHTLLIYIQKNVKEKGVSPSFEEMKEYMNLKSKSGIHRLICQLEKRKFLRRLPGKARALEVITLPEIRSLHAKILPVVHAPTSTIPLYGKIAAGVPIEAVNDTPECIDVPAQMMGGGEHYALVVEGDSMKNAGIMDGDTVVIKKKTDVLNGQIGVALIDGYEVTLKRIYKKGDTIALQPENDAYETRLFSADRIEIQGYLVGLMRHY
ncbi:MAG: transcriptional repressor LexA [Lactobacillales bacterium]|jgi:repressor LexA|nr:transcriptional repressor LexA [Lactobacillales bacterium]